MDSWPTGPEAVAHLEEWCAMHGTTLSQLGASCQPEVHRSTFTRWRNGSQPDRRVYERLTLGMAIYDAVKLQQLLGGSNGEE